MDRKRAASARATPCAIAGTLAPDSRPRADAWHHGQVAPPLESAAVLSPAPQTVNVPDAVLEYLYEVPEPVQPDGRRGDPLRNGPPTWFWPFASGQSGALPAGDGTGGCARPVVGETSAVCGVDPDGRGDGPGVGLGLGDPGPGLHVRIERHSDGGQDADDGHDDEQLDQGETLASFHG